MIGNSYNVNKLNDVILQDMLQGRNKYLMVAYHKNTVDKQIHQLFK